MGKPRRTTSLLAWESLKRSGKLTKSQWHVYDYLFRHGPLTARELNGQLSAVFGGAAAPSYHKRLSELQRMGLVRESGVRRCEYSRRQVILWDVTSEERAQQLPRRRKRTSPVTRVLNRFLDLAGEMEARGLRSAAQMVRNRVDSIRNPKEEGERGQPRNTATDARHHGG